MVLVVLLQGVEASSETSVIGALIAIILALIGTGVYQRFRNGKQGESDNPNAQTLQVLIEQLIKCADKTEENTNETLQMLTGMKEALNGLKDVVGVCDAVRQMGKRKGT